MITYKIHFIRTGKTGLKQEQRYVGQYDAPLCEDGIKELTEKADAFIYPKAGMVFTSPLTRCVETAEILYPDTYLKTVDGLIDLSLGEFEGKTFEELRGDADFSRWINNSFENTPTGGEEITAFIERLTITAGEIFKFMMDERITDAAVITHGGAIMTLLAAIGLPKLPLHEWACGNGEGYTLLFTPQMWMRDGSAEVYCRQPGTLMQDDDGNSDWQ